MANSEIAVVIKYPEEKAEATLPAQNPKEKAEATSLAENPKEKVTSNNPDSSSKDIREESAVEDNHESNIFSPKVDKNPKKESFLQNYWKKIFVASCLCGVLVDPLFLYVPLIKDDVKCLILDQKLKIAAVILRSVTDLFYILDIIFRIYGSENYSDFIKQLLTPRKLPRSRLIRRSCVPTIAKAIWGSNDILIDILAILPLPQVFGAVWYFFAIQRMMECWHSACRKEDGCDSSSFGCHDHHTFRNIKILNDLCPINPSDAKMFDLGIFTSVLESGITGSTNYFQKFSNCFWWGLRNLSSLGSNLEPSVNGWENLFTTSISIIGLLLFLYLIGNLQMYMQFENAKREEHNRKLRLTRRTEQFGPEIELWLFKNGIPTKSHKEMKSQVSEKVQQAIEGNRDVNLDNVLPTLPADFQSRIKKCSPLTKLKQVFSGLDEIALKEMCQYLKPKKFMKNDIIIEQGKPLKEMVFIMDGLVDIEKRNSNGSCNTSQRGAGELCGQDLLLRGSRSNGEYAQAFGQDLLCEYRPNREHAKAFGDVEALVIMAEDMESVRSRFKQQIDAYERYLHVDAYERYLHVHKSEPKRQKVGGRKRSHDIELEISQSC
ncbi:cyclic nucleotide-gated ion channel 1-like isoform X3 [Malus domestica]|uniref:cyclic nucleotide-gated ion channel 1-like isoform X3 n=1 Tax=Malus domestica TaxID=3750 RepID=UPI000498D111|nr:putative cyclic nucleotide-gated ion channel 9 isoform X3 [Malus domestica]